MPKTATIPILGKICSIVSVWWYCWLTVNVLVLPLFCWPKSTCLLRNMRLSCCPTPSCFTAKSSLLVSCHPPQFCGKKTRRFWLAATTPMSVNPPWLATNPNTCWLVYEYPHNMYVYDCISRCTFVMRLTGNFYKMMKT